MVAMGFVQNYGGLITARFFLGAIEAGFKPGIRLCAAATKQVLTKLKE
jgi:hypothetical protein